MEKEIEALVKKDEVHIKFRKPKFLQWVKPLVLIYALGVSLTGQPMTKPVIVGCILLGLLILWEMPHEVWRFLKQSVEDCTDHVFEYNTEDSNWYCKNCQYSKKEMTRKDKRV